MESSSKTFEGPNIGDIIEGYEVLTPLGSGGMGRVYKVRNTLSNRIDAMKILLPDLEGDPGLTARFLSEIQVLGGLSHPNIAGLYTAMRVGNRFAMILELVEGEPLSARIKAGRLTPQEAINHICQVLEAIGYAHQKGVIHRDIKPGNIILTPDGAVKLVDFGIAKSAASPSLTATGAAVGSAFYMSPEQVLGRPLDCRSDLYSVGITLYEMVTGERPIRGDTEYTIMDGHLHKVPDPAHTLNPAVSPALSAIIAKALAKDPAERFQTAEAFLTAVREWRVEHAAPTPAKQPPARRRPLWVVASVGVTAIAVLALGGLLISTRKGRPTPEPPPQIAQSPVRTSPVPPAPQPLAKTSAVPNRTPSQPNAVAATLPVTPPPHANANPVPVTPANRKPAEAKPEVAKVNPAPTPVEHGMDSWGASGWTNDQGWSVHRGGDFVLYPVSPTRGMFEFAALKRHGKRIRWVLRYKDPRNYLLFEIDGKTFSRKEVDNGRIIGPVEVVHGTSEAAFTLQIEVHPESITHRIYTKGAWKTVEDWRQPGQDFDSGSFGFLLGKDDEIGLSNFRFVSEPPVVSTAKPK